MAVNEFREASKFLIGSTEFCWEHALPFQVLMLTPLCGDHGADTLGKANLESKAVVICCSDMS